VGARDQPHRHGALHGEAPGRNCAYGSAGSGTDEESLATIERDLEKAWEDGMVDLHLLPGPDIDAYAAGSAKIAANAAD
jgi:hypothetical protein